MKEDKIKMKIACNKQLNGMNMNIKCIQRGGKNSVPFTIKPSKTLECKKGQKSSIGAEYNRKKEISFNEPWNQKRTQQTIIKCIQRKGKNSVPFTIKPSKTLECKKGQKSSIGD